MAPKGKGKGNKANGTTVKDVDPTTELKENIKRLEEYIKVQDETVSTLGKRNQMLSNTNHATVDSLSVERAELMARVDKIDMRIKGLTHGDERASATGSTMSLRKWVEQDRHS